MRQEELVHTPIWDAIIITLTAIFLGPPIGGFVLGVGYVLVGVFVSVETIIFGTGSPKISEYLQFLLTPILFALASYILGAVPAGISAILISCHAWLRKCLDFRIISGWITLVTFFYAMALFSGGEWAIDKTSLTLFAIFLSCGLVSGWVLYRFLGNYVSVWKNPRY